MPQRRNLAKNYLVLPKPCSESYPACMANELPIVGIMVKVHLSGLAFAYWT